MNVTEAEQVVASLEQKRIKCVMRGTELQDERASIALSAHTAGDASARKRLDEINSEIAVHSSELASLDAAIKAAGNKLEKARQYEAKAEDRQRVAALRKELETFRQHGMALDAAIAALETHGHALAVSMTNLHALGCVTPSHQQLDVLGYQALATALMATPWRKRFEHLPPNQRRTFGSLIDAWSNTVENRLNQSKETKDAA